LAEHAVLPAEDVDQKQSSTRRERKSSASTAETKHVPAAPHTAVAGVSGYAGGELARLLLRHPRLRGVPPMFLGRLDEAAAEPVPVDTIHPELGGLFSSSDHSDSPISDKTISTAAAPLVLPFTWDLLEHREIDLLYLATPHEQSRAWVPEAIARGIRVIDLSAAWRLDDPENRAVYKLSDDDAAVAAKLQSEAVYGSPELHRDEIRTARLVANPGCYATSIILALAPLMRAGVIDRGRGIVCDAKSGVSGAGKAATAKTHFMYAADNLSAYAVFGHRHTGELLEQLSLSSDEIRFTPHLLPIPRGILSTIYMRLRERTQPEQISRIFAEFFAGSPMVRLRRTPELPQIAHVVRTNFCDIGFELAANGRDMVIVSCLDNLLKGAAGQAVQNMNVMYGFGESEGLL
jgi:N-acetyl-gamma-glutamyl-phosphate reductase